MKSRRDFCAQEQERVRLHLVSIATTWAEVTGRPSSCLLVPCGCFTLTCREEELCVTLAGVATRETSLHPNLSIITGCSPLPLNTFSAFSLIFVVPEQKV